MDLLQMRTEIGAVAAGIGLGPDVCGAVAECAQNVLNEETVRLCARLTEPETARDAAQRISERFVQDPGGAAKLTLFLGAACLAREKWAQIGVADEIFWDTAACLARFVQEMRQRTGQPLFDREQWAWRQMCGRLFRLGTLEFEYVIVEEGACRPWGVQPGQAVLSVHIPGDRPLTEQSLRESYRQAAAFWEKYEAAFCPAGRPVLWCCDSWLLSPMLAQCLPASSAIRTFARAYELYDVDPADESFYFWLFGGKKEPEELEQRTSLQRAVAEKLRRGEPIGSARGFLAFLK